MAAGLLFMAVVMTAATFATAGWSLGDAVCMVILTVYSVGYGEVRPLDTALLRGITLPRWCSAAPASSS